MEYRRMGKTGLELSVLSYGSWVTFHKQIDDSKADQLMSIAYENGVNFFDNAETYANGESELMMGRVLKTKDWERTSYTLSSKAYFGWKGKDAKPNQTGLSRKHLMEACTSQWSGAEIMEAHRVASQYNLIGPTVEQPQYNMFERFKVEQDYLPVYKNVGLGTTIWSPLAAGFLTGKYNNGIPDDSRLAIEGFEWLKNRWIQDAKLEKVKKLSTLAGEMNVSLASLAIAWTIKNPHVTTTILGATKKEQLLENFKALTVLPLLTDAVMEKIENILQNKPVMDLA
jgi:aryl-alcohol dehydrogenase-like predicted oxidoreductase